MNILYEYNSATDRDEITGKELLKVRASGIIPIFLSLQMFMNNSWTEFSVMDKILFTAAMLSGLFTTIFPIQASRPYIKLTNKYLTIDKEKIKWNLGGKSSQGQIRLVEISSWKKHVGEVYFTTKDGQSHKLETHKIYSKLKHAEFFTFLKEDLMHRISTTTSLSD